MATSLETGTKQQYVDFDEYIDFQLKKTRAGIKATDVLTAIVGASTLVLGYLLLFVVLDHWVIPNGFGSKTRIAMLLVVSLAATVWIVWRAVLPYFRRVNGLFAAKLIEQSEPSLNSNLLNLVDLRQSGQAPAAGVARSMEKRTALALSHMDVDQAVDRGLLMRISYVLLAIVVLLCMYTLFSPKKISPSVWRALLPAANVSVATRTEITAVEPGDVEVLARTQLEVIVDLRGENPEQVELLYTTADRRFVDQPIVMRSVEDGIKQYRAIVTGENGRGILQNLTYRIVAGDATAGPFEVKVHQPPTAKVDSVRYQYPQYMAMKEKSVADARIDAWEGTTVTLTATANMPVTSAIILFSDTEQTFQKAEEIRMEVVDGTQLTATWKLAIREDGTFPHFYRIECRNDRGETDPQPALSPVNIRPDLPPEVALFDPVRDLEMPANGIVPLVVVARDPDFLLRFVTLRIERAGEELPGQTIFDGLEQSFSTTYDFHLKPLNLKPDETISFWIEARDNKQPLGNRKNTTKLNIRIIEPIADEDVQKELKEEKQRQEEKLQQSSEKNDQKSGKQGDKQSEGDKGEKPDDAGEKQGDKKKPGDSDQKSKQQDGGDKSKQKQGAGGQKKKQDDQSSEGEQKKFNPDGDDDQEVLEKLIRREEKRNQPDGQQKPDGDQSGEKQEDKGEKGSDKKKGADNKKDQEDNGPDGSPGEKGDDNGKGKGDKNAKGGKPGDSDKPASGSSPGDGDKDSESKSKPGDAKQSKKDLKGEESPADDSPDAKQKKATGDEKGKATPETDPNADSTKAKNKLDRKPGTKPSTKPSKDKSKKGDADKSRSGGANEKPETAKPSSKTKKGDPKSPDTKKKPGSMKKDDEKRPAARRDDQPDGADEPVKGKGRPPGQKSKRPDGGEKGESKQSSEGTKGSNKKGPGDSSDKPGDADPSKKPKDGQPNGPKGDGKKTQGDKKSGGKSQADSNEDKGQNGQGQGAGKPGDKKGESSSSSPSDQVGKTGGQKPGGAIGGSPNKGPAGDGDAGGGGTGHSGPTDEANLEYAKQASNLVLKRLQDELKRGEVDRELLKELGWNEDQLKKFAGRLQKQLQAENGQQTPESLTRRRQFEEMLKSLNLNSRGTRRTGENVRKRRTDGIGSRRLPVPAEYRELYEAYTRSLSRKTTGRKPSAPGKKK